MDFIGEIESSHVGVELKYCERCGGLFLRPQSSAVVYCVSCATRLATQPEFAEAFNSSAPSKKRTPRMVKGPKIRERQIQGAAKIECLRGVAAEGVLVC